MWVPKRKAKEREGKIMEEKAKGVIVKSGWNRRGKGAR